MRLTRCEVQCSEQVKVLTPQLLRQWLRRSGAPPPSTYVDRPNQALSLLNYCMSDLIDDEPESVAQLAGLPLLPLANGTFTTFKLAPSGDAFQGLVPTSSAL